MSIEIIIAIAGSILGLIGVANATLLGFLLNKVYSLRKDVIDIVERERFESIMAQRRINVLDSTVSDICSKKFDSRQVVEGKHDYPKINEKLSKFIAQEK